MTKIAWKLMAAKGQDIIWFRFVNGQNSFGIPDIFANDPPNPYAYLNGHPIIFVRRQLAADGYDLKEVNPDTHQVEDWPYKSGDEPYANGDSST